MGKYISKLNFLHKRRRRKTSSEGQLLKYTYEPLPKGDYFRLLNLEPGVGDEPLVTSIHTSELRSNSHEYHFEAISYVWGSDTKDQVITVDGSPLPITSNLRDSLRQVRLPDKPRQIWADSICIDQTNNAEKGQQVAAMGRIYQTSECTLICLRCEEEFRQHAINAAAIIQEVDKMIEEVLNSHEFSGTWDSFPHPDVHDPLVNDPRWESWRVLVNNPWFLRGWVIQEAALGPDAKIMWAGAEISWMSLLRVYQWLAYRGSPQMQSSDQFWLSPLHVQKFKVERPDEDKTYWPEDAPSRIGPSPTLEMLDYARQLKLGDPRDRIYAFMAIPTEDATMSTIKPDYDAHYLSIYQDFALSYLKLTSDLDILLYVEGNEETSSSDSQLASWIPRWDHGYSINSRLFIPGRKVGIPSFTLKGPSIQTQAIIFGPVQFISDRIKPVDEEPDTFGQVLALWRQLQVSQKSIEHREPYPHQGSLGLAFIQAINCGVYEGSLEEWIESIREFARLLESDQPQNSTNPSPPAEVAQRLSKFGINISKNRRFIALGQGNYGLAPSAIQPGDVCAIIYGTSWPFILRQVPGTDHWYKVVGPAYILSRQADEYGIPDRLGYDEKCEDWKDWGLPDLRITLC
ncbi:heterokaryon incompatibility protein-domain-containing protein [Annulohypoxylon stygium]|nr:heterokaryon incompatibility protein-domain-containing protein [Annulohypoxylon stygium]